MTHAIQFGPFGLDGSSTDWTEAGRGEIRLDDRARFWLHHAWLFPIHCDRSEIALSDSEDGGGEDLSVPSVITK